MGSIALEDVRVRDLLALPAAYDAFGALVGVARVRTVFTSEHVRPRAGERLLDLGCGPGSLTPFLPAVHYTGVDVNPKYIAAARRHFPAARFICDRIGDETARGEQFDVVTAAGVLHHLSDAEALALLQLASARLRPGGRFLTLDPCLIEGQSRVARWLARWDRGDHVRWKDAHVRLIQQVFPGATATLRHNLLHVPYTHVIVESTRS